MLSSNTTKQRQPLSLTLPYVQQKKIMHHIIPPKTSIVNYATELVTLVQAVMLQHGRKRLLFTDNIKVHQFSVTLD